MDKKIMIVALVVVVIAVVAVAAYAMTSGDDDDDKNITFDGNGGLTSNNESTVKSSASTAPGQIFFKTGMTLTSYNTAKDGTGTSIAPEGKVPNGVDKMYAQYLYNLHVGTTGNAGVDRANVTVSMSGTDCTDTKIGNLNAVNSPTVLPKNAVFTLKCDSCNEIQKMSSGLIIFDFTDMTLCLGIDIEGATSSVTVDGKTVTIKVNPTGSTVIDLSTNYFKYYLDLEAPTGFEFKLVSKTGDSDPVVTDLKTGTNTPYIHLDTEYSIRLECTDDTWVFDGYQYKVSGNWSITYNDGSARHSLYITADGPTVYDTSLSSPYTYYADFEISLEWDGWASNMLDLTFSDTKA